MDIKGIREHKKVLEKDLQMSIAGRVAVFEENTGVSPDTIHVSMVEITNFESPKREWLVGEVQVNISI